MLGAFWGWVKDAVYEGERTVHERPLDLWGATVSVDVHLPHLVDKPGTSVALTFAHMRVCLNRHWPYVLRFGVLLVELSPR